MDLYGKDSIPILGASLKEPFYHLFPAKFILHFRVLFYCLHRKYDGRRKNIQFQNFHQKVPNIILKFELKATTKLLKSKWPSG